MIERIVLLDPSFPVSGLSCQRNLLVLQCQFRVRLSPDHQIHMIGPAIVPDNELSAACSSSKGK